MEAQQFYIEGKLTKKTLNLLLLLIPEFRLSYFTPIRTSVDGLCVHASGLWRPCLSEGVDWKCRTWKWGTKKMKDMKMQDLKMKDHRNRTGKWRTSVI